ncbi:HEWD family protein [Natronomonas gomsonensis]|uniref:HEWD family protein n=1 Tax=Natronomonas gomsonensis TaxID=1046043 RepID=UPI0015C166F6|nr:HEWD family protein [Natronomonas gomsonensis]
MADEIVPPTERRCELCGRTDRWDADTQNWVIAVEDGERQVGNKHCIHEWDINGRYNPVEGKPNVDADA